MCRFCVEHGEGERWYLQAKNYAFDLESDLRRRGYIVEFVRDFDSKRSSAIAAANALAKLPGPLERIGKAAISKRMQGVHFGQPVPLEDCEQILALATSITVIPCICRMHAADKPAAEVCILVTMQPIESLLEEAFADYADGPDLADFHRVDSDEAVALLRKCEEEGLMHSVWTFRTPFTAAICNCNLESGCLAMKLTVDHQVKLMWRGEHVARIDGERCTSCGRCSMACPFGAIELDRVGIASSDARFAGQMASQHVTDCWGCGICRTVCRADAIELVDRRSIPQVAGLW